MLIESLSAHRFLLVLQTVVEFLVFGEFDQSDSPEKTHPPYENKHRYGSFYYEWVVFIIREPYE